MRCAVCAVAGDWSVVSWQSCRLERTWDSLACCLKSTAGTGPRAATKTAPPRVRSSFSLSYTRCQSTCNASDSQYWFVGSIVRLPAYGMPYYCQLFAIRLAPSCLVVRLSNIKHCSMPGSHIYSAYLWSLDRRLAARFHDMTTIPSHSDSHLLHNMCQLGEPCARCVSGNYIRNAATICFTASVRVTSNLLRTTSREGDKN
jgi:hypothetical protein